MINKKLVVLLVIVILALVGIAYTIEKSARPISDRTGAAAQGESDHEH